MNIALILAGGIGSRTGENIPKQFIQVNEKPMIIYTLEKFEKCNDIDKIYVVCVKNWIERLEKYIKDFKISKIKKIVSGGKNGLESVYKGLISMEEIDDNDIILIHDSARPFIDIKSIKENVRVAKKYGLAMSAINCVETLVYSKDGTFADKIIPRDNLKRILTPQSFKYSILKELYSDKNFINSNEPSTFALYMSKGLPIYCSQGNEKNIKITYPEDIKYFRKLFDESETSISKNEQSLDTVHTHTHTHTHTQYI